MGIGWGKYSDDGTNMGPYSTTKPVDPLTMGELQHFMEQVKYAADLGDQVHRKSVLLLEERDETDRKLQSLSTFSSGLQNRITTLQNEKERLKARKKNLEEQNDAFRKLIEQLQEKLIQQNELVQERDALKNQEQQLIRRLNEETEMRKKAQDDVKKMKKIIDPLKEMTRKGQVIAAGVQTHDNVASTFSSLFSNRRLLKPLNITDSVGRATFLTQLFEYAYALCATEIINISVNELQKLHVAPLESVSVENSEEKVSIIRSRIDAYSCLMSISGAKEQPPPLSVIEKVMEVQFLNELVTDENKKDAWGIVNKVVETCWQMLQLSPPMTLGLQPSCDEELFDKKALKGQMEDVEFEEQLKLPNKRLKLLCPTLYYSPYGTYKKKGTVAIVSAVHVDGQDDSSTEVVQLVEQINKDTPQVNGHHESNEKDEPETINEDTQLKEHKNNHESEGKSETDMNKVPNGHDYSSTNGVGNDEKISKNTWDSSTIEPSKIGTMDEEVHSSEKPNKHKDPADEAGSTLLRNSGIILTNEPVSLVLAQSKPPNNTINQNNKGAKEPSKRDTVNKKMLSSENPSKQKGHKDATDEAASDVSIITVKSQRSPDKAAKGENQALKQSKEDPTNIEEKEAAVTESYNASVCKEFVQQQDNLHNAEKGAEKKKRKRKRNHNTDSMKSQEMSHLERGRDSSSLNGSEYH